MWIIKLYMSKLGLLMIMGHFRIILSMNLLIHEQLFALKLFFLLPLTRVKHSILEKCTQNLLCADPKHWFWQLRVMWGR